MNRKLHNTASALFASAGLLVLGLIAASPAPLAGTDAAFATGADPAEREQFESAAHRVEALAAQAASLAVMAETLETLEGTDAPPRTAPTRKARRSHQSVAMPFFSFAPRG